jgi:HK97 family phage portal protein
MSLIESISRGASQFHADMTGAPAPWDDFWYGPLGVSSAAGMRVSADSAKRIAAVLACVNIISRNVAMMPVKIFTETSDGGKKTVPNYPLYEVLATQPNQHQTAFEFYQLMQGHFELRGNAYAEIIPGSRAAVEQLLPMHPDRVTVDRLRSGRILYRYNDPLTNETRTLVQEEVFHLRNWSDDGVVGQSTIAMAVDVFGTALAEQDYTARFFKNDARPGGIIEGTNFRDQDAEDQFRESWQHSQTAKNRHKTALLPMGLSYKDIGVKPSDSQLLDARKFSRIEICSIFGVPPHLIGETEKTATYASVEQFNIMFAVQCLLPRVVMWEQAIQRDLILTSAYFPKFSMAALLRGDTASRYAAYQIAIQNGWLCQDDVRALEDLNPIADGSGRTYWRPLNWAPLGQIQSAPAPPAADPEPDEVTDTDQGTPGGPNDASHLGRLNLLARSAADRCVRKEVGALRKMVDRAASVGEFETFYAGHTGFIVGALHLPASLAIQYGAARCAALATVETRASVIDQIERAGAIELAALAVKGIQ